MAAPLSPGRRPSPMEPAHGAPGILPGDLDRDKDSHSPGSGAEIKPRARVVWGGSPGGPATRTGHGRLLSGVASVPLSPGAEVL